MRALRRMLGRAAHLLPERRSHARLREELEAHLCALAAQHMHEGMEAGEARRRAQQALGPQALVEEQWHAEHTLPWLEHLAWDARYALRRLRRAPWLSLGAILMLALGIGINLSALGVLNSLVLEPLPVRQPAQLYQLRNQQWTEGKLLTTSYPAWQDLARRNTTFTGMAAVDGYAAARLTQGRMDMRVNGDAVSSNYFDLLGIAPQRGRVFHAADEHGADSAPYVVLSDALWHSAFHADPRVVGSTVLLDRVPYQVLGIAPAAFHGVDRFAWPDYWIPIVEEGSAFLQDRSAVDVTVLGRLRSGVTPKQAVDNLDAVLAGLAREYPLTDRRGGVRLIRPGLLGDDGSVIRGFLWGVSALALLVLATACANLANLFAARATDRAAELRLRMALGASRMRVARQLLLEVAMLAAAGGTAALAGAHLLLRLLTAWRPAFGGHVVVYAGPRVSLAAVALTLGSTIAAGLLPARRAWAGDTAAPAYRGPGKRPSATDLLLTLQVAICTLLVCASLVAVRGMQHVLATPLGFRPHGALLVTAGPGAAADPAQARQAVLDALRQVPGITAAGAVSRAPMTGGMHGEPVFRQGTTEFTLDHAALSPYVFALSPGYIGAAGMRLLRGRDVAEQDTAQNPAVAVVNESFAHSLWGRRQILGRHFLLQHRLTTVIGVVEDGKYHDLEEASQPVVYVPFAQDDPGSVVFVARSPRPPGPEAAAVARAVRGVLPESPITVEPWPAAMAAELFPARAAAAVLGALGALAILLAVTGTFGVAAYGVSRRLRELGVRSALGASRAQLLRAALGRVAALLLAGACAGMVAAALAEGVLRAVVYRATIWDPFVLGGTLLSMLLAGVAAGALPARRALHVDAATLLREN